MKELLLKIFNKKAYWTIKMTRIAKELRVAESLWQDAVKKHSRSRELRLKYELAKIRFEKAYPEYLKAMGKI
jgi:hypothetical protein